ncbi:hypothetical protein LDENG_00065960 [Lucifuga dentata]|nr:hypothetical protein LDENG_00065960 [Lucifuga dentata]
MKSFERLVKNELVSRVEGLLDPMQFAYRTGLGVEDANATLLNLILKHLEGINSHARLLFVDFSSAFNTIRPYILFRKLLSVFNIDVDTSKWIVDFLSCRLQRVRVNGTLWQQCMSSAGSPQGCVFDCRSKHQNRHVLKFADDTVIIRFMMKRILTDQCLITLYSDVHSRLYKIICTKLYR